MATLGADDRLERWREAKANRDFVTADAIRAELRAEGMDPDKPEHSGRGKWANDDRLDRWREAKANRDFATADAIRTELRAEGIDPDKPGQSRSTQYWILEDKMRKWKSAKESKDYTTADALRTELREMGMDPEPKGGGKGMMAASYALAATPQWGYAEGPVSQWGSPSASWGMPGGWPAGGKWSGGGPGAVSKVDASYGYVKQVEGQLDQWQEAKANKDWNTADMIRETLRSMGVEPQTARPNKWSLEEESEQWMRAKQAGDYTRADRLRTSLRAKGVDPEPPSGKKSGGGGGKKALGNGYDAEVEEELRQWYEAKDQKDWGVADSIREGLRAKGIEPAKQQRPAPRYAPY